MHGYRQNQYIYVLKCNYEYILAEFLNKAKSGQKCMNCITYILLCYSFKTYILFEKCQTFSTIPFVAKYSCALHNPFNIFVDKGKHRWCSRATTVWFQ